MNPIATAAGAGFSQAPDQAAFANDGMSLMDRAQQRPEQRLQKPLTKEQLVATLAAARQEFSQLQSRNPMSAGGLGALNEHNAYLTAAQARLQQLEAAYRQTFGTVPAELERLRGGGV